MACLDVSHERSGDTCSARTRTHTFAHKPLQAVLAPLSVDFGRRPMNITLVMSSSITTTLIMAVGSTGVAAVAYSKPVLVRMNVPVTLLFGTSRSVCVCVCNGTLLLVVIG